VTKYEPRPAAGAVEASTGVQRWDNWEPLVLRCSEQDVLWWLCRLLLRRMHPWPHQDSAGPGIVEGGPRRGTPAIVTTIVAGATGAIVLAFPLPLALTLVVATIVGVGDRKGRGHRRTWWFLLWWVWRLLLLWRVPST
jgi:hypothetical protein